MELDENVKQHQQEQDQEDDAFHGIEEVYDPEEPPAESVEGDPKMSVDEIKSQLMSITQMMQSSDLFGEINRLKLEMDTIRQAMGQVGQAVQAVNKAHAIPVGEAPAPLSPGEAREGSRIEGEERVYDDEVVVGDEGEVWVDDDEVVVGDEEATAYGMSDNKVVVGDEEEDPGRVDDADVLVGDEGVVRPARQPWQDPEEQERRRKKAEAEIWEERARAKWVEERMARYRRGQIKEQEGLWSLPPFSWARRYVMDLLEDSIPMMVFRLALLFVFLLMVYRKLLAMFEVWHAVPGGAEDGFGSGEDSGYDDSFGFLGSLLGLKLDAEGEL